MKEALLREFKPTPQRQIHRRKESIINTNKYTNFRKKFVIFSKHIHWGQKDVFDEKRRKKISCHCSFRY
jgi:hypothetical protein